MNLEIIANLIEIGTFITLVILLIIVLIKKIKVKIKAKSRLREYNDDLFDENQELIVKLLKQKKKIKKLKNT